MRLATLVLAALGPCVCAAAAFAQTPAFDPRTWKGRVAGPLTEVLVLGSPHLSQLPGPFRVETLAPLLDRLAAYRPEVITHEGLSGEQCDTLARYAATYPDVFETYCRGTAEAAKATGFSVPQAQAEVEKILAAWPAAPAAAQRRHLAALFLAAGDRPSALVQWLRLVPVERRAGDGLDATLAGFLERKGEKPNETFDIGSALAARLGLDRVHAVDDHTADSIQAKAGPGIGAALEKIWSAPPPPARAAIMAREKSLATGQDVLALYRTYNDPATLRGFIESDFGAAIAQPSPERYGRRYVAWWETRNLRMVANIRAAFGDKPGARVLSIVGASHKAYFDAYLDMMHEVRLVDAEAVLR